MRTIKKLVLGGGVYVLTGAANAIDTSEFDAAINDVKMQVGSSLTAELARDLEAIRKQGPLIRSVDSTKNAPERVWTVDDYINLFVTDWRVALGRKALQENGEFLEQMRERFGVSPEYIVAILAVETNLGRTTGDQEAMRALLTLGAGDSKRNNYFRKEAVSLLELANKHDWPLLDIRSSYAGALGVSQFMPWNVQNLSVDGDGDGLHDPWNLHDGMASTGNYLMQRGEWRPGWRWGRPVMGATCPADGDKSQRLALKNWSEQGVKLRDGSPLPVGDSDAVLWCIDDRQFLVYQNGEAIGTYNHSKHYVVAVGMLADELVWQRVDG